MRSRRLAAMTGNSLQANEALEVLGLRPEATSVQIKEAYRDLVKVWHPDRFGNDVRLRQKAGEKLQQINEAYRVLQAGSGAMGGSGAVPPASAHYASSARYTSSSARGSVAARRRGGPRRISMGWFYGLVVGALVALLGYMVIEHAVTRGEGPTPASVEPVASSSVSASSGGVTTGQDGHLAGTSRRAGGDAKGNGAAGFTVRSLSDAESARLQDACEPQRERLGQAAYQVCVSAQVASMTNPAGRPDLGALNEVERESIESACGEARRARGADGYDRCLTAKMAEWAAEPARPRLSALSEADRASVELACRGAKEREGPAAYDRCLVRFTKALADAR